jgi:hypothetical protein
MLSELSFLNQGCEMRDVEWEMSCSDTDCSFKLGEPRKVL